MVRFIAVALIALAASSSCMAGETISPRNSEDGGVLVITAIHSIAVPNDTLTASLIAEMSGDDATRLAREVNQIVALARKAVGGDPAVALRTLSYATQPDFENGKRTGWSVQQAIQMESRDFDLASKRLAELQALGVKLTGLGFSLGSAARERTQLAAKEDALRAWMAQAEMAMKTLGAKRWRPGRLALHDGHPPANESGADGFGLASHRDAGTKGNRADEYPPLVSLDPGETSVVVSVQGEALIDYAP